MGATPRSGCGGDARGPDRHGPCAGCADRGGYSAHFAADVPVGLVAFYAGKAAADAIAHYGIYGGIAIGIAVVLFIAALHVVRRRAEEA